MITRGLSNEEIAKAVYLSINTVKSYIRRAYRKMGVDSRSRAILLAVDRGFTTRSGAPCVATGLPATANGVVTRRSAVHSDRVCLALDDRLTQPEPPATRSRHLQGADPLSHPRAWCGVGHTPAYWA